MDSASHPYTISAMVIQKQLAPLVDALNKKKKVTFFLGAGVSTSCGIPDFRSPKTGLYANLKRLELPYPEAVFDIDYFRENPKAFYTLCQELYPGKFIPSRFHFLLKIFEEENLMARIYSQNIDTLERLAGVDESYIVEAHGSFAANHCIDCNKEVSVADVKKAVFAKEIPECSECKGYVKPDIVFFGEGLPARFFELWDEDADQVEVAIVAGTSLTVYPFAGLPSEVGKKALRVLINKELVGDFKVTNRKSDLIFQHDCDEMANHIAEAMGWTERLHALLSKAKSEFENENSPEKSRESSVEPKNEPTKEDEKAHKVAQAVAQSMTEADETAESEQSELEEKLGKLKF